MGVILPQNRLVITRPFVPRPAGHGGDKSTLGIIVSSKRGVFREKSVELPAVSWHGRRSVRLFLDPVAFTQAPGRSPEQEIALTPR